MDCFLNILNIQFVILQNVQTKYFSCCNTESNIFYGIFLSLIKTKQMIARLNLLYGKILTFFMLIIVLVLQSCAEVKEYQKAYLNDDEMKLSQRALEQYETNFEGYREGSSGAEGGKTGGGCGCN
jgi:hypothetical protein